MAPPVRLFLIAITALIVELFVFNWAFWGTAGNRPIVLCDEPVTIRSGEQTIEFDDLDVNASTITIGFSDGQGNGTVFARYTIADDGMSTPYTLPEAEMQKDVVRSLTQSLYPYGSLHSLMISFPEGEDRNDDSGQLLDANAYPIIVTSVTLNAPVPFSFNPLRLFLILGVLLLLYAFRPRSRIYRFAALDTGRAARAARTLSVVGLTVLLCAGILAFPNWMQFATSWYNAGEWDGSSAVSLVEPDWLADVGNDEYDQLARSLVQGSVVLQEQPPAWLSQVENPYDPGVQQTMAKETGEASKVDAAYYDGNYYVYFGVVPVLALYLPFYMLTGYDLPNAIALMVPCMLFVIGLYFLLCTLVRRKFPRVNLGVFLLVYVATVACSAIIFGIGRPTLYQVPIAFARCLTVWGLFLWFEGRGTGCSAQLVGGSVCMALVAGCRPQFLLFSLAAMPLIFVSGAGSSRQGDNTPNNTPNQWVPPMCRGVVVAAVVTPFIVVAAGLAWYNAVRFGSPFDFGASRNLAGNDMSLRGFVPVRLVDGLFAYLLQPPYMVTRFPFLVPVDLSTSYLGLSITEPLAGGVFATQPFLWAALGGLGLRRVRPRVFAAVVFLLVAGIVVCCFDTQASGILGRYYQDFSLFFAVAAALSVFAFFDDTACSHDVRLVGKRGLLYLAVIFTMGYSLLAFLFMLDNAGCNTAGGSDPGTWEFLRQTFEWWI